MKQLATLVRPFPANLVHENPSGQGRGSYVSHDTVVQRLLQVLGPYDFRLVDTLRGDTKDGKFVGVVVGAVCELTVTIDGRRVSVQDVGDCENPANWPHDGARMKDAISDAIKRCAMRLGCGLHLWSQGDFYLYEALQRELKSDGASESGSPPETAPVDPVGEGIRGTAVSDPPLTGDDVGELEDDQVVPPPAGLRGRRGSAA